MPIRGEGLVADTTTPAATTTTHNATDKTVYVLHPNCAVEEM
jgi:uncharacterized protein YjdB